MRTPSLRSQSAIVKGERQRRERGRSLTNLYGKIKLFGHVYVGRIGKMGLRLDGHGGSASVGRGATVIHIHKVTVHLGSGSGLFQPRADHDDALAPKAMGTSRYISGCNYYSDDSDDNDDSGPFSALGRVIDPNCSRKLQFCSCDESTSYTF